MTEQDAFYYAFLALEQSISKEHEMLRSYQLNGGFDDSYIASRLQNVANYKKAISTLNQLRVTI